MQPIINTKIIAFAIILLASMLTGCASIVKGTSQVVSVETTNNGQAVEGASCTLENDRGVLYLTTPGTVAVHRDYGDLSVKCEKENLSPGVTKVRSSANAAAYGNILLGGVIGIAVDANNGAAFDYPALIAVDLGQTANKAIVQTALSGQAETAQAVAVEVPAAQTGAVIPLSAQAHEAAPSASAGEQVRNATPSTEPGQQRELARLAANDAARPEIPTTKRADLKESRAHAFDWAFKRVGELHPDLDPGSFMYNPDLMMKVLASAGKYEKRGMSAAEAYLTAVSDFKD